MCNHYVHGPLGEEARGVVLVYYAWWRDALTEQSLVNHWAGKMWDAWQNVSNLLGIQYYFWVPFCWTRCRCGWDPVMNDVHIHAQTPQSSAYCIHAALGIGFTTFCLDKHSCSTNCRLCSQQRELINTQTGLISLPHPHSHTLPSRRGHWFTLTFKKRCLHLTPQQLTLTCQMHWILFSWLLPWNINFCTRS